ncbi:GNAT family N-acetyltransferase [Rhodococcus sp. Z13]|uniref:GNAT family N-acetyltransferase n=1 Tax=Rhodococcus sacchari TaxID=2962047 RepID=A0ACD4DI80_9NOCA|nr:GNAT family N-acetyltransferase [Rhodococcus sp. Z13]UYP19681.1 GNAT family N-acetyltransferase [Rhodococcus sp. Z13]
MHERILTDGTVVLSPPRAADVDAITEACRDPEIARWTTVPDPYTRADAVHFVGTVVPDKWAKGFPDWAVRTEPDGRVCGMVGFVPREGDDLEIGYWIASTARGRGLATAAVRLACGFAFAADGMGVRRIGWRAFVGNHASAAVARRVGFRFEGITPAGLLQRGVPRDVWVAGLSADDPPGPADGWPLRPERRLR